MTCSSGMDRQPTQYLSPIPARAQANNVDDATRVTATYIPGAVGWQTHH
jgi:hypothetical protein